MAANSSSTTLLTVLILALIWVVSFSSRLFSVVRYESVIHEFDPWFNYRTSIQLVEHGFYEFLNWFDDMTWYPLGRVVGGTVYPGLMLTSGVMHAFLHALNIPIDIRNVCVFLAPVFSGLTAIATYLFTSELKDSSAGLLAALFIGIAPGYISRSVAGSYDNEGVSIFALMIVFWLWLKAMKTGSAFWACLTALGYFYMVSAWGGYVFIINMIPLHVLILLLMGRYTNRLYVAYCTMYVLGTIGSMEIPFIGFQPVQTSEHMAALGIFGLLQIYAFFDYLRSKMGQKEFGSLFNALVFLIFSVAFLGMLGLTAAGYIRPWGGRFYSLWDTSYARKYIPIIASVSEHQPTAWTSYFFDLNTMVIFFPAGLVMCFLYLKDEHIFAIVYGVFGSYFSGIMVRLMLTLTPITSVLSAVAISAVYDTYLRENTFVSPFKSDLFKPKKAESGKGKAPEKTAEKTAEKTEKKSSDKSAIDPDLRLIVVAVLTFVLAVFPLHCTYVTSSAYSSPSIVLASRNPDGSQYIIDDFREAYFWLRKNTRPDAKVMSWWDYGYQITGMANRTVLVDNNTWNNTHIATVGKAMSVTEEKSFEIMKRHDVDYALVIFGGTLGYSGDDINKFLWMIRIGQGVYPNDVREVDFFTSRGEYKIDRDATPTMRNSLMYKMSYYRFGEYGPYGQTGIDRVRGTEVGEKNIKLSVIEEAFTSQHWIVRIYKVKDLDNFGRSMRAAAKFEQEGSKRKKKPKN